MTYYARMAVSDISHSALHHLLRAILPEGGVDIYMSYIKANQADSVSSMIIMAACDRERPNPEVVSSVSRHSTSKAIMISRNSVIMSNMAYICGKKKKKRDVKRIAKNIIIHSIAYQ